MSESGVFFFLPDACSLQGSETLRWLALDAIPPRAWEAGTTPGSAGLAPAAREQNQTHIHVKATTPTLGCSDVRQNWEYESGKLVELVMSICNAALSM